MVPFTKNSRAIRLHEDEMGIWVVSFSHHELLGTNRFEAQQGFSEKLIIWSWKNMIGDRWIDWGGGHIMFKNQTDATLCYLAFA